MSAKSKYFCSYCDYGTDHKSDYTKHSNSDKHITKKANQSETLNIDRSQYNKDNVVPLPSGLKYGLLLPPHPVDNIKFYWDVEFNIGNASTPSEVANCLIKVFALKHKLDKGYQIPFVKSKIKILPKSENVPNKAVASLFVNHSEEFDQCYIENGQVNWQTYDGNLMKDTCQRLQSYYLRAIEIGDSKAQKQVDEYGESIECEAMYQRQHISGLGKSMMMNDKLRKAIEQQFKDLLVN